MQHQPRAGRTRFFRLVWVLILLGVLLSACGGTNQQQASGPVTVTYTFVGGAQKDLKVVEGEINNYLKTKLPNVRISLNLLDWGTYDQRMPLSFKANKSCDIVFTASWINNYYDRVANHNLLDLTSLLPGDAPQLYSSIDKKLWNAVSVNGKIYGVPTQQFFPKTWGVAVRKDLADKYGLNLDSINSLSDLTPFLAKLKAGEPELLAPLYQEKGANYGNTFLPETYGWDTLGDNFLVQVKANDTDRKVFSYYTTPEFKSSIQLHNSWLQKGYMEKDQAEPAQAQARFRAGKYAVIIGDQWRETSPATLKSKFNYDFVGKSLAPDMITTASVVAGLNAICRNSAHPKEALQFLQALNTDAHLFNLLSYGVENKHWVWVDKAKNLIGLPDGKTADTASYWPNTTWEFGNTFLAYYTDPVAASQDLNTVEKKANDNALASVGLGFHLDKEPIKTQAANIDTVNSDYGDLLGGKKFSEDLWNKYQKALNDAGIQEVIKEGQSQMDAWAKTITQ